MRLGIACYFTSTEKVGSDSGGEDCSILYLKLTGGDVLIRETEIEETQFESTFHS